MKKKLLLIALFSLFLSKAVAQTWEKYADFPVNVNPIDVDINNAGTFFMLTSDSRIFYKLQNQNWTEMPNFGLQNFRTIKSKKNSNRLYIGDIYQGLIATSNFGQSYELLFISTDPLSGFHESVVALSNPNSNGVFFGASFNGFDPTIIKYTNNGNTGQVINFDPTNNSGNIIDEMLFTTSNTLLMGTENGGIWFSTDQGQTFQHSNFDQHNVFSFTEGANGTVYALGFDYIQNQSFLIQSPDYINWTELELPNPSIKYKTVFFENNTNNLWIASETDLYRTPITGDSITSWNMANYNNSNQSCTELLSYNGVVFNFTKEHVAQSLSNNNLWSSPLTQGLNGISSYAGFGQNNKLFSAYYASPTISTLNSSTDNWNNAIVSNAYPNNLIIKPGGRIYLHLSNQILKSTNNGISYTEITPPNVGESFVYRFYVGENNSLFAVIGNDNQKIYRSLNDGAEWSLFADFTSPAPFDPAIINSIAEDATGKIFVMVTSLSIFSGFNYIYYTVDQGNSWNYITYNAEVHQDDCGSSLNVVRSVGAMTFCEPCSKTYKLNLSNVADPFGNEITFNGNSITPQSLKINGNNDYYIQYNGIHKSTNQGQTWTSLGFPNEITEPNIQISDLFFDNNYNLFAVTYANNNTPQGIRGFYKLTEQLGVNTEEKNNFRVSPNPAVSFVNINSETPLKAVILFDATGKKIKTTTSNTLNIDDVAQGVYMLYIEDLEGNNAVKKIIKNN